MHSTTILCDIDYLYLLYTCKILMSFLIVGNTLEIHSASLNGKMDIVSFNWSAANVDDIKILQISILSNTEEIFRTIDNSDRDGIAIVGVALEPGEYNVTLTAFDTCGQNYSSLPYLLTIPKPQLSSHSVLSTPPYLAPTSFCDPVVTPTMESCNCIDKGKILCFLHTIVL